MAGAAEATPETVTLAGVRTAVALLARHRAPEVPRQDVLEGHDPGDILAAMESIAGGLLAGAERLDRTLRSWLMFTGHPGEQIHGYPERDMVQYVWCGKRPVRAEALGPAPDRASGRPAERTGPQQWFRFGPWRFDVTGAGRLLREHPRDTCELPIAPWVAAYGGTAGIAPQLPGVAAPLDAGYAMKADLRQPLLVVTLPADGTREMPAGLARALPRNDRGELLVLADGLHRLYKAHAVGTEKLPCYVLSASETGAIRAELVAS